MSRRQELAALLLIALAGTLLRFYRLGALSFAADEDITVLAALALLDGWPPTLPGGLDYVRALPFTVLEAIAVAIGGTGEGVLRAIPVLFAFPRIIGVWWLARVFLPAPLALACAGVLALAPFDIEFSRIARMYSPFATLDLLFVAALVHLSLGRGRGLLAAAFGIASASMHTLTVAHTPLAWLAAMGSGVQRATRLRLVVTGVVVFLAFLFFDSVERVAYAPMGLGSGTGHLLPRPFREHLGRLGAALDPVEGKVFMAVAGLLASILVARSFSRLTDPWARLLAVSAGLAFLLASPVLAGIALIASLILQGFAPGTPRQALVASDVLRYSLVPWVTAGALLTATWVVLGAISRPPDESALRAAAEMLIGYPAPNWLDVVRASPALTALAAIGIAVAAWNGARNRKLGPAWLILIVAAVAPALVTGIVSRSEALRFQAHAFAPLVVLAVCGVRWCVHWVQMPRNAGFAIATLVALLAVRPDRGVAIVLREHGPIGEPYAIFEVAPDHRSAGRFVREHAVPEDWIVGEDSMQLRHYAGRVDYWLRRPEDASAFLARASTQKDPCDIYTGARLLPDMDSLMRLSSTEPATLIWLVTSAEAEPRPRYYRTPDTSQALKDIEPLASFVAEDGITRVYRIRAGRIEPIF